MIVLGTWKGKSFKESLKSLEADIQLANTLALSFPNGKEGACLQMRLSYGPAAHFLLFFVSWTDCRLAGTLGLLHILIYKVMKDGNTTMSVSERKASLREFYAYVLPSLQVLEGGVSEKAAQQQQASYMDRYKKRPNDSMGGHKSQIDLEREQECGICFEVVTKIVLPGCNHSMCLQCYRDWRDKSLSCPFCRVSLKHVNSKDLWIYVDYTDVEDTQTLTKKNLKRLFKYVDKLPLVITKNAYDTKRKRHL